MRYLLENQDNNGFLQKTHLYSRAQSGIFLVIFKQRITKFSVKDVNLETIIDTLWVYKTWQHSGYNHTHVEQQLLRTRRRACKSSWSPARKPKVIYTDNSLEFGKACEDLSWNHCTSTPHRSETDGIAERAVRRVKEGTSAVLLQSGLNESWWADSTECYTYLRNVTDLLSDGKTPYERRFGQPF